MDPRDPDARRRAALSPLFGPDDKRPPSSTVLVTVAARSHQGSVRLHNEDHYLVLRMSREQETLATSLSGNDVPPPFRESAYAMLVADGLGPGGSGSVASRVALSTIAHLALNSGEWNVRVDRDTAAHILERAEWLYSQADTAVHTRAASSPILKGMTTSLTAAYSAGTDLFVAHVGHSRAYLFRDGQLLRLTRDHTVAQHATERSGPVAVGGGAQDVRHILTAAIGTPAGDPSIEVDQYRLLNGDCVMVCTNGLSDVLDEAQIAELLAQRRAPDEQCRMLIEMANRAGAGDNVTVVLAEYQIGN
jgi:serine/threonine protein phosphatase PrpC